MPSPIEALGTVGLLGGVAAAGNNRQSAFILDLLAHFRAVVGLVGGDGQWRSGRVEHVANDLTVVDLPAPPERRAPSKEGFGIAR